MNSAGNIDLIRYDKAVMNGAAVSAKPAAAYKARNFGLDTIRSAAILIVVFLHINLVLFSVKLTSSIWYFPDGVTIFFVLSGYLIGGILIHTIRENGSTKKSLLRFWNMRWFRTLPNYFLFTFIVFLLFNHGRIKWVNLFFLQNFYKTQNEVFIETWSLSVEEWFYLLFPLLLFALHRVTGNLKKSIVWTVLLFCIAGICTKYYYITRYLQITFSNMQLHDPKWFEIKSLVVNRMDCISIGIIGAYLRIYYLDYWKRYTRLCFLLGLMIVVVCTVIENNLFHNIVATRNPVFWSAFYPACGVGVLLLFPWMEDLQCKNKYIKSFLSHTSKISYTMYLLHLSLLKIILLVFLLLKISLTPVRAMLVIVTYLFILYAMCNVIYKFFEKGFIDYRGVFIAKYLK